MTAGTYYLKGLRKWSFKLYTLEKRLLAIVLRKHECQNCWNSQKAVSVVLENDVVELCSTCSAHLYPKHVKMVEIHKVKYLFRRKDLDNGN